MYTYDSFHSIERAEERANMSRLGAQKMINRAREYGKRAYELPSDERHYMMSKEGCGTYTIFHEGYCFVLSENNECITLYRVPQWFCKGIRFDGKTRIKNVKKYYKMQTEYEVC